MPWIVAAYNLKYFEYLHAALGDAMHAIITVERRLRDLNM